jgi:hypothetical protein
MMTYITKFCNSSVRDLGRFRVFRVQCVVRAAPDTNIGSSAAAFTVLKNKTSFDIGMLLKTYTNSGRIRHLL